MAKKQFDSLIETIRRAMLSETQRDVSFVEHSWWSQLLHYDGRGRRVSNADFRLRDHRGKKLIIAHYLVDLCRCVLMGILWLVYACFDAIRYFVSGKKGDAGRSREDRPASIWVNFLILITILIFSIVGLVFILSFGIRSVVLPPSKMHVNSSGVVSIEQPHLEEQHFFLLNAATGWYRTDIRISKGDKVYITAAGGMYNDVGEMYDKANDNDTLLYPRYSFSYGEKNTENVQYCIYGRKDSAEAQEARFGSLLYQVGKQHIAPQSYNTDSCSSVKQILFDSASRTKPFVFTSDSSGVLFFSFNDILLDPAIIEKICDTSKLDKLHDSGKPYSLRDKLLKLCPEDSLKKYCGKGKKDKKKSCGLKDTLYVLEKFLDPQIWFKDNIGEVLINVRVEKSICNSPLPCRKKAIVGLYRELDHFFCSLHNSPCRFGKNFCDCISRILSKDFCRYIRDIFNSSCIPWFLVGILAIFIIDVLISNSIRRRMRKKNKSKNLTKEEFNVLVMLYAAKIDGSVKGDELDVVLEKSHPTAFAEMKKMLRKMSDIEILSCIAEHASKYTATETDRQELFASVHDIFAADGRHSAMENHLMRVLKKILTK